MPGANDPTGRLPRELRRRFAILQTCVAAIELDCEGAECLRWLEATIDAADECEGVVAQLQQLPAPPHRGRREARRRR